MAHRHPHLHLLVTDGAFRRDGSFVGVPAHEPAVLAEAWRRAVLALFVREGWLEEDAAAAMLAWPHSGFSSCVEPAIAAEDRAAVLGVARSGARTPGRAQEQFEFVDQHPVDRLVIDLRQNGGGDFNQGRRHFIEPISRHPTINREGHLFVILGPITFSAALANAIDFRNRTRATLVGEPIGEKPNSHSENDEFVLPRSHLTVSYSTKYYEFAPGQEVLTPNRLIVPKWEEFRAGRDPVLDWVLTCCR